MPHGNAFNQANAKHKRSKTTAAITDEWKRQTRNGQHIQIHADVDRALKKDQGRHAKGDHRTSHITRLLRRTNTAPDNERQG